MSVGLAQGTVAVLGAANIAGVLCLLEQDGHRPLRWLVHAAGPHAATAAAWIRTAVARLDTWVGNVVPSHAGQHS